MWNGTLQKLIILGELAQTSIFVSDVIYFCRLFLVSRCFRKDLHVFDFLIESKCDRQSDNLWSFPFALQLTTGHKINFFFW